MEESQAQYATDKLAQLKSQYQIEIASDWGYDDSSGTKSWRVGNWSRTELDNLHKYIDLLSGAMGGLDKFVKNLGGVTVRKSDIGSHAGEALAHRVSLATKGAFSAWTVVHEFAHAWDANHNWKLSAQLEKYTGGYTSPLLSLIKRLTGLSDSGVFDQENRPGRHGRKPGCNAAGYFYGDTPSGSNWKFNRVEDFAESVAMYVAWEKNNDLSDWARARINRYLLVDGAADKNFGTDNWSYYKKYFYPENGDYTKTKRWQFVDDLVNGRIEIT